MSRSADAIFLIDNGKKIEWAVRVPIISGNLSRTIILAVVSFTSSYDVIGRFSSGFRVGVVRVLLHAFCWDGGRIPNNNN